MKLKKGFTLVEVVISLALVSLMIVFVISTFTISVKVKQKKMQELRSIEECSNIVKIASSSVFSLDEELKLLNFENNLNFYYNVDDIRLLLGENVIHLDNDFKYETKGNIEIKLSIEENNSNIRIFIEVFGDGKEIYSIPDEFIVGEV